jgi:thiamine-monophosphate kinase
MSNIPPEPAASEFTLIERYFAAQDCQRPDVVLGIGDDGALLLPAAGQHLVVTLDTLVADVHFFADTDPQGLGHKALAVNLSDLAAMGATPAWITLGLTLPRADAAWLARFCQGLFALADRYGVQLVGGDTTHGPGPVISIQAHGFVPPGQALRRDGARPGDVLYVTGTPGDAGLALAAALGTATVAAEHRPFIQQRLERPEPRMAQGLALRGIASAAIDVSDGLAQDLGHVLRRSGVGARLVVDQLPLSPALLAQADRDAALTLALAGGDDYELCFSVPPDRVAQLERVAADWECRCTRLGVITAQPGLHLLRADGCAFPLQRGGYDHFN